MSKKRVLLTEEDFKALISGEIVEKDNVQIALQDIGYYNMYYIISKQVEESENPF